jgi:hypothetical protein
MNAFGFLFTFVMSALLVRLPRSLAPLPILMGASYVTLSQQLEIGPLHFPVGRVLIAVGIFRVMSRGERIARGVNSLDRIMIYLAIWSICSLVFHKPTVLIFRLGILYDALGTYYLFRIFIQKPEDVRLVFKMVCLILLPVAATMLVEKFKGVNLLSLIGFGEAEVNSTNGHFRAQGAFGHAILAGNVGAVSLPMAVYFWRKQRKLALTGIAVTLAMVFASGSSGPIMTTMAVIGALALWKIRGSLRAIRWSAVFVVIGLSFLMKDPPYFLLARIDITGGSTGYFRAQLIKSTIEHFNEWWLAGTDFTRHWMPSGIPANGEHTDMTNYYIQMGVWGGLLLMLLFISLLVAGFNRVGKALQANKNAPADRQFLIWTLGAILFGHVTTFVSISYFDQTVVFLYLALACIGSLQILPPAPVPNPRRAPTWSNKMAPRHVPSMRFQPS